MKKLLKFDEAEKMANKELTDEFVRDVENSDKKIDELTASLAPSMRLEEKVLYFSLIHNRAKSLGVAAHALSMASGFRLAFVQENLLNEQLEQENWARAQPIAHALFNLAKYLDDPTYMFIAAFKLGAATFNLEHYEPAKDILNSALKIFPRARAELLTSEPDQIKLFDQWEALIREQLVALEENFPAKKN